MRRSVRFHPGALQDADGAAGWYAERSIRTGLRFLNELERLIDVIADSPQRFPIFDFDLRRAIFRRFPFYIVFRADDVRIVVFAVAHGKWRPRFWQDRNWKLVEAGFTCPAGAASCISRT